MTGTPGESVADALLKALPPEDAEVVLAKLPDRARERLRAYRTERTRPRPTSPRPFANSSTSSKLPHARPRS